MKTATQGLLGYLHCRTDSDVNPALLFRYCSIAHRHLLVVGVLTAAIGSDAGIPGQSDSSPFSFLGHFQLGNYSDT